MKKALVGLMVALMAVSSFGGVVVGWTAYGFQSGANSSLGILEDSSTTLMLWDLVYTTSDTFTAPTLNESTGVIEYGSDVLVSERVVTPNGDKTGTGVVTDLISTPQTSATPLKFEGEGYSEDSGLQYTNLEIAYTTGNLYAAVFQYTASGDVYAAFTDLNTAINWTNNGMMPGDAVDFSVLDSTYLSSFGHVTQIPEPATMSLLGLGALAMMIRRKLRK